MGLTAVMAIRFMEAVATMVGIGTIQTIAITIITMIKGRLHRVTGVITGPMVTAIIRIIIIIMSKITTITGRNHAQIKRLDFGVTTTGRHMATNTGMTAIGKSVITATTATRKTVQIGRGATINRRHPGQFRESSRQGLIHRPNLLMPPIVLGQDSARSRIIRNQTGATGKGAITRRSNPDRKSLPHLDRLRRIRT